MRLLSICVSGLFVCTITGTVSAAPVKTKRTAGGIRGTASSVRARPIATSELQNFDCVIPCLGDGADYTVHMKNGSYKIKNDSMNGAEQGSLSHVTAGTMDGHPVAVGCLNWTTGGSGNWDSILLFRRVNGKIATVGKFSVGYPGNQSAGYENFRVLKDRVCFNIKDVDIECTTVSADVPDSEPKPPALADLDVLNAKIPVMTREKLREQAGDVESVQLKDGKYTKGDLICTINHISHLSLDGKPVTLAAARVEYKGAGAPVLVIYRFRRYEGNPMCDGYYSLCNDYDLKDIARLRLVTNERFQRKGDAGFDVIDATLKSADFQKPTLN
ncbi:MAG TPA: hypothetical protein V6C72_01775 [Chroococcales cyanobacterium]